MRAELTQAADLLRQRDTAKMGEVLRLLQETVYSFSMKFCGHREDAEDNMQEVLMKALPHLAALESPDALAVWLYKVTRNRCWESRRRSKFAPRQMLTLEELLPDGKDMAALVTRPHHGPENRAIARQESDRLAEVVRLLPAKYRMVLVLHDMEDLTTAQVAEVLGLREATVRVRLHRGRLFVRRGLSSPPQPIPPAAPQKRRGHGPRPGHRGKHDMSCQEMFRGLSDYLDQGTEQSVCAQMQHHLEECPECMLFLKDLAQVVASCRAQSVPCPPEVHEKIRRHLLEEWQRLAQQQHPKRRPNKGPGKRRHKINHKFCNEVL
jgi:RNA polymerase sigma-70 factor (ECF subfamily)